MHRITQCDVLAGYLNVNIVDYSAFAIDTTFHKYKGQTVLKEGRRREDHGWRSQFVDCRGDLISNQQSNIAALTPDVYPIAKPSQPYALQHPRHRISQTPPRTKPWNKPPSQNPRDATRALHTRKRAEWLAHVLSRLRKSTPPFLNPPKSRPTGPLYPLYFLLQRVANCFSDFFEPRG